MKSSRRSVMKHKFSEVPNVEMQRSSFDRSHGLKTTIDGGLLIPVLVDECLPGDTFNLKMTALARLATPLKPTMDNMYLDTFFFAVPYRLVWQNWERFNGAQTNPGDSTDFLIPQIDTSGGTGTALGLGDYFGIPPAMADIDYSALPSRCYYLIWNEWFRDQNMQNSLTVPTDNGPEVPGNYLLQRRGKRHDYFTSALPWPQKTDPVTLSLGTSAPVVGIGDLIPLFDMQGGTDRSIDTDPGANSDLIHSGANIGSSAPIEWADTKLETDLTAATAITINQLREGFQVQRMFEKDARGGTRYTEIIRSHFGVTSPDSRLQRPEYLGGGSTRVNITPVEANTSNTFAGEELGNLGGFGTAVIHNNGFTKSFTEHCIIIGLVSVRADLTYQQGINRMWSRSTRFDFYWPSLSHLGEQEILNKEIFADGSANDDLVFGYQERFAEYRYKPSMITGIFRSSHAQSLDFWHLSQDFATLPALNASFIEDNPPIDRIIAVPSEPHFLLDCYFNYRCARPMPLYGVPGLIDHF